MKIKFYKYHQVFFYYMFRWNQLTFNLSSFLPIAICPWDKASSFSASGTFWKWFPFFISKSFFLHILSAEDCWTSLPIFSTSLETISIHLKRNGKTEWKDESIPFTIRKFKKNRTPANFSMPHGEFIMIHIYWWNFRMNLVLNDIDMVKEVWSLYSQVATNSME